MFLLPSYNSVMLIHDLILVRALMKYLDMPGMVDITLKHINWISSAFC